MKKKYILEKSNRKDKKYMIKNGKTIHFGQSGYSDFTINKNETIKRNYIARHKVRENWNDLNSAGAWSGGILWNEKSIPKSIKSMESKFNINIINRINK
tara:strand:- start:297 stop:593 length:297 start_codon:yes stop_codon:yes gene_type:complete